MARSPVQRPLITTLGAAFVTLAAVAGITFGGTIARCADDGIGPAACLRADLVERGLLVVADSPPPPASLQPASPGSGSQESDSQVLDPQASGFQDFGLFGPGRDAAGSSQLPSAPVEGEGALRLGEMAGEGAQPVIGARVEPDGSAVLMGFVAPGAMVELLVNETVLGRTQADEIGSWVVVPDTPLPPGTSRIVLRTQSGQGDAELADEALEIRISADPDIPPEVRPVTLGSQLAPLSGIAPEAGTVSGPAPDIGVQQEGGAEQEGGAGQENGTVSGALDGQGIPPSAQGIPPSAQGTPSSAQDTPPPSGDVLPADGQTSSTGAQALSSDGEDVSAGNASASASEMALPVGEAAADPVADMAQPAGAELEIVELEVAELEVAGAGTPETQSTKAGERVEAGGRVEAGADEAIAFPQQPPLVQTPAGQVSLPETPAQPPAGGEDAGTAPVEAVDAELSPPSPSTVAPVISTQDRQDTPSLVQQATPSDMPSVLPPSVSGVPGQENEANPVPPLAALPATPDADQPAPDAIAPPPAPSVSSPSAPAVPATAPSLPLLTLPAIDAVEIDGGRIFVAGAGQEGYQMRLFIDGAYVGSSPVSGGRWLVEAPYSAGTGLSRRLRVDMVAGTRDVLVARAVMNFAIRPQVPVSPPASSGASAPPASEEAVPAVLQNVIEPQSADRQDFEPEPSESMVSGPVMTPEDRELEDRELEDRDKSGRDAPLPEAGFSGNEQPGDTGREPAPLPVPQTETVVQDDVGMVISDASVQQESVSLSGASAGAGEEGGEGTEHNTTPVQEPEGQETTGQRPVETPGAMQGARTSEAGASPEPEAGEADLQPDPGPRDESGLQAEPVAVAKTLPPSTAIDPGPVPENSGQEDASAPLPAEPETPLLQDIVEPVAGEDEPVAPAGTAFADSVPTESVPTESVALETAVTGQPGMDGEGRENGPDGQASADMQDKVDGQEQTDEQEQADERERQTQPARSEETVQLVLPVSSLTVSDGGQAVSGQSGAETDVTQPEGTVFPGGSGIARPGDAASAMEAGSDMPLEPEPVLNAGQTETRAPVTDRDDAGQIPPRQQLSAGEEPPVPGELPRPAGAFELTGPSEPDEPAGPEDASAPVDQPGSATPSVSPNPSVSTGMEQIVSSEQGVSTLTLTAVGDPEKGRFSSGKVIIRRGDNLWTIASRVYGQGLRYVAIFEANRDQIANPHWIFPGQVFDLPYQTTPIPPLPAGLPASRSLPAD